MECAQGPKVPTSLCSGVVQRECRRRQKGVGAGRVG